MNSTLQKQFVGMHPLRVWRASLTPPTCKHAASVLSQRRGDGHSVTPAQVAGWERGRFATAATRALIEVLTKGAVQANDWPTLRCPHCHARQTEPVDADTIASVAAANAAG